MPVGGVGGSAGTSGRALGWEWRLIWNGSAVPASLPVGADPQERSGRTGRRPARPSGRPATGRPGSGCRAARPAPVLETVRYSDQRNASARSAGGGDRERGAGHPAGQRGHAGLGVDAPVVDVLDPGGEQPVHLGQVVDLPPGLAVAGGDLDDELAVDGAEEAFDLAPALGPARAWSGPA